MKDNLFYNDVFKFNVHSFFGCSEEFVIESIADNYFDGNKDDVWDFDNCDGKCIEFYHDNNGPNYIIFCRDANYFTLSHEALHVAKYVVEARGLLKEDDELQCYLMEWIMKKAAE